MSLKDKIPTRGEIDIPRPKRFPETVALCRLVEVDFETASLTLRGLVNRLPTLAAGNYVVQRQEDWCAMRDAAQGPSQ